MTCSPSLASSWESFAKESRTTSTLPRLDSRGRRRALGWFVADQGVEDATTERDGGELRSDPLRVQPCIGVTAG